MKLDKSITLFKQITLMSFLWSQQTPVYGKAT